MEEKNREEKREIKKSKRLSLNKNSIIWISLHLLMGISSYLIMCNYTMPKMQLGDFGSIFLVLLLVISVQGLKWLPIFSIIGVILNIFSEKFKELQKVFNFINVFVYIISLLVLFLM